MRALLQRGRAYGTVPGSECYHQSTAGAHADFHATLAHNHPTSAFTVLLTLALIPG